MRVLMNTRYDIAQISKIISDFANVTGLSIAFLDTDFNYIASYTYNDPDFCRKIQNCRFGSERCLHSDLKMLKECRKTRSFVSHPCHAGIIDSVMPVLKDMVLIGYILLGRVRPSENMEDIYPNIAWILDDESYCRKNTAEQEEALASLRESYLKLSYFNSGQMESICRLVSSSLFANAIEIVFEEPLKAVVAYISDNLNGDLSATKLCQVSCLSKTKLSAPKIRRNFAVFSKKETGLTPSAYRRETHQPG